MNLTDQSHELLIQLQSRILVLDGAIGTQLQQLSLTADDFGGTSFEGCNEHLVLTRPDIITDIHRLYLDAGADIIETDTFGGTPLVLSEYGLDQKTYEINFEAAKIAHRVAQEVSTVEKPRFVAGSMGPTTRALSISVGISFWELVAYYREQARGLYDGGADYFLLETCQDTRNIKAGLIAIGEVLSTQSRAIPVAVSATIEPNGTMLAGQAVDALSISVEHTDLVYLGLNCSTGPEFMRDHIRTLAKTSRFRTACVPNAGIPDANGQYLDTPDVIEAVLGSFCDQEWLNVIGGCCGTGPEHIRALNNLAQLKKPRQPAHRRSSRLSGIEVLEISSDNRPVLVGERTNAIGSRRFKRLICSNHIDQASDIARSQIRRGAQIIDICLSNPDRNEKDDMVRFLDQVVRKIKAPLMIDSMDESVIREALTYSQGKAIINSVNLEHPDRFEIIVPLAKQFGAAIVVGTIDAQGMALTRQRKIEIATRSYELLTKKFSVPEEDIYFDCLVFPCGTGAPQYFGSARETIEGVRLIKEKYPNCRTVLGISNVSFGLPEVGREVLNAVFLYHAVQAGLDLAIANPEKLERYVSLSMEERALAEHLLFNQDAAILERFAATFQTREKKPRETVRLSLEERLSEAILQANKEHLVDDLNEACNRYSALEIINGPLMKGMEQVGDLFNRNEMIVAEVLQSAEVMKTAVTHLERQLSENNQQITRATMLLCTVKGDVHDIGKNLVDIIFSNNGYRIINLGTRIAPEQLIIAVQKYHPDLIGISGLLVKSAFQMVDTVRDLSGAGIRIPIIIGGAALSKQFSEQRIAPAYRGIVAYAKDAMSGLRLANEILGLHANENPRPTNLMRQPAGTQTNGFFEKVSTQTRSSEIAPIPDPPEPPDLDRHIENSLPIDQVFRFVNPKTLFGRHLGIKKELIHLIELGTIENVKDSHAKSARDVFLAVRDQLRRYEANILKPRALYQFFRAESEGNLLHIFDSRDHRIESFNFLRQRKPNGICLSDFVNPKGDTPDFICACVATVGNTGKEADRLKEEGRYLESHVLHALALQLAEAYAELLHSKLRALWGFPDSAKLAMKDRFRARYRGRRYSFGYPACPNLEDQAKLWKLIHPEEIGVQLTETFMMDPESSVSALVFHHPDAKYFSV